VRRVLFWAGVAGLAYSAVLLLGTIGKGKSASYYTQTIFAPIPLGSAAAVVVSRLVK
jgi:hypothetical protein